MARDLRIEFPGAIYHVMVHGNGKQWLYKTSDDMKIFLQGLNKVVDKFKFKIYAFVLMRNHFHLLLETPVGQLSKGMMYLNQYIARELNKKMDRTGSVLRHRYKAILIEDDTYFLNVFKYIYKNPINENIVKYPSDYPGSALYYLLRDKNKIKNVLSMDKVLFYFEDINSILRFVAEGNSEYNENISIFYGSQKWINEIKEKYVDINSISDQIVGYHEFIENETNRIFSIVDKNAKSVYRDKDIINIKIYLLYKYTPLTNREIVKVFHNLTPDAVAKRLGRFKELLKVDEKLKKYVISLERKIKNEG